MGDFPKSSICWKGVPHPFWGFIQFFEIINDLVEALSGWWLTYPSETYEFVSWDDDIPNIWKHNPNVPNHQADYFGDSLDPIDASDCCVVVFFLVIFHEKSTI